MIGKIFGKLTVIKFFPSRNGIGGRCECLCICGNKRISQLSALISGHTKSCGCYKDHHKLRIKDISGQQFGQLTVIKQAPQKRIGEILWLCRCACGNEAITRGTALRYGHVGSCGCMNGIPNSPDYPRAVLNWVIRMYIGGAKSRQLDFKLSDEEFLNIIQKPCHYCGNSGRDWGAKWYEEKVRRVKRGVTKNFDENAKDFSLMGNGIDRLSNTECYTVQNCVPCCTTCNMMKKALTEEEFLNHIKQIMIFRKL